ncbi:hypothetical protein LSAT2_013033 [Lamellibrachia satsuma]|nr:hypothetical protein LSAT2_013033 [Lamellibrachia satsuma]
MDHLSPRNGTIQTTYLWTTLQPPTPVCFYCYRRGALLCLTPGLLCDGVYDCSDRSDEHNCANKVGRSTEPPLREKDGTKRSVSMNAVFVGLLVLFGFLVVGSIVVGLVRMFNVLSQHCAERSSPITSTEQESPYVDDHRRPPSYSLTTDIGNAESDYRPLPDCVPAVPEEAPPPSYADVCESEGWV